MRFFQQNIGVFIALILSACCYGYMGYYLERSNFPYLIGLFTILFACYGYIYRFTSREGLGILVTFGVLFRLGMLFYLPNLSDDYFRFVWDGKLLVNGENPFLHLPSYYMEQGNEIAGLTPALFDGLNSPEYYTIYPPICQFIFGLANFIFPTDIYKCVVFIKCILFIAEIGSIFLLGFLLNHFHLSPKSLLLYALNPLVIVELTGNLHFEGLMIFFLLASLSLIIKNRYNLSVLTFALAVCSKLLPLMFLPFFIKRLGIKKSLIYFIYLGIVCVILFTPFLSKAFIENLYSSIDLYFQKFEFNASIYYITRWIGYQFTGYNIIQTAGPILSLITVTTIILMSAFERVPKWNSLPQKFLLALSAYLFFATIIHPWYVTTLVALSVLSNYRFAIVWSSLIPLSYYTYQTTAYVENLWLVAIEYTIVFGILGYELFWSYKNNRNVI